MTDKALQLAQIQVLGICECGHFAKMHAYHNSAAVGACQDRAENWPCDCQQFRPVRFTVTREKGDR